MIVQLIVQIEMKIDEDQLIVAVFTRKTRDLFPNVEVTERDRPIYGPTLTADDRRVMNRINAILVVCKEVIRSDDPSSGSDSDNSDDNRRRRPRRGRGRGHGRVFFHRVVVEIIPIVIIRDSRTIVLWAKMTISVFPKGRYRGSNCRSSMEECLGRVSGHTSKTALCTIIGVNATN